MMNKTTRIQQSIHHKVHQLKKSMGPEEALDWLALLAYPDPLIDWETGLELGDSCPKHGEPLSWLPVPTNSERHLYCNRCEQ